MPLHVTNTRVMCMNDILEWIFCVGVCIEIFYLFSNTVL